MRKLSKFLALLLVGTLTFSLSACGTSGNSSTTAGAADSTEKTEENSDAEEKIVTVGVTNLIDQPFDPAQVTNTFSDQAAPLYDALITMDGEGNYSEGLATSWELSEDKTQFTLQLRDGVKFHDGSDLTSEDVKFTLEYYASDESNQGDKNLLIKYVKDIETPDDQTVVINFNEPCAEFEYLLSSNGTGTGIVLPSDYFESVGIEGFAYSPIGTGKFKLESYTAGESIVYAVNEDYWGQKPSYDKLILKKFSEESALVAEIQAGNVDFAEVTSESATILESSGITIDKAEYATTLGLFVGGAYENTGAALQNKSVREALLLAINREEIVNAIFGGNAVAADVWGVFPFTFGYDENNIPKQELNVEKAKSLLEEAGYPDSFENPVIKFYVTTPGKSYYETIAQVLVSTWKDLGVSVEIVPIDKPTLASLYRARPLSEEFAGSIFFFEPPKKYSAFDAFQPFFPSASPIGLIQGNETVDKGVSEIVSLSGDERIDKVAEVLHAVDEEKVVYPLVYPGTYYALGSRVKSYNKLASGHVGFWYAEIELN